MKPLTLLLLLPLSAIAADCHLQVVDGRAAELVAIPGGTAQDAITYQLGAPEYPALATGLRIDTVELWDTLPTKQGFKSIKHHATVPLESDGSAQVEVPCETPIRMMGMYGEQDGPIDHMLHSLRKGERRVCWGCHIHSEEANAKLEGTAAEAFAKTIAGEK